MLYKKNNLELYYLNQRVNEAIVRKNNEISFNSIIKKGIELFDKINEESTTMNKINYKLIEIDSSGNKKNINFGIKKNENREYLLIIPFDTKFLLSWNNIFDTRFNVYILIQYSDDKKIQNFYFLNNMKKEHSVFHYTANFINCIDIPFFRNSLKKQLPLIFDNTDKLIKFSNVNLSKRLVKSNSFQRIRYLYPYLDSKQIKSLHDKFKSEIKNKKYINSYYLRVLDEYSFYLLDRIILNYKKKNLNNFVDYYIVNSKALTEIEKILNDLSYAIEIK